MNSSRKTTRLKSLRGASAKWRRRNHTERVLLLEAFTLLGVARLALLVLPFRWVVESLGKHMEETDTYLSPGDLQLARMVGQVVRSAANYTPWESVCLPQAVAAKWMVKRRRIAGTLYLGVMKDTTNPKKMAAHAWLRCGPVIITGAKGHRQFTVVSTFS